jgi:hypothetical protein
MPTTLPDRSARDRDRRPQWLAELVSVVAVMLYLLLLAWSMATFEANSGVPQQGRYNPMEPGHRIASGPGGPIGWLAQR